MQPASTIQINSDTTIEQPNSTKVLMMTTSGSKVVSLNSIDAKQAEMSLFDKH